MKLPLLRQEERVVVVQSRVDRQIPLLETTDGKGSVVERVLLVRQLLLVSLCAASYVLQEALAGLHVHQDLLVDGDPLFELGDNFHALANSGFASSNFTLLCKPLSGCLSSSRRSKHIAQE